MIEFARRKQLSFRIEIFDGTIADIYLEQKRNVVKQANVLLLLLSYPLSLLFARFFLSHRFCLQRCSRFFCCLSVFLPSLSSIITTLLFEGQELCLLVSFVFSHDDYMDGRQQPPADQLETMMEDRYRCC